MCYSSCFTLFHGCLVQKEMRNLKMLECPALAEFLEDWFFFFFVVVDLYQCKKHNFMAEIKPEQFCTLPNFVSQLTTRRRLGAKYASSPIKPHGTQSPDFQYASLWLLFFHVWISEWMSLSFILIGVGLIIILIFLKEEIYFYPPYLRHFSLYFWKYYDLVTYYIPKI